MTRGRVCSGYVDTTVLVLTFVSVIALTSNQDLPSSAKDFCEGTDECEKTVGAFEKLSMAAKYQEPQDWVVFQKNIEAAQRDFKVDENDAKICRPTDGCTCGFEELILKELAPFSKGISRKLVDQAMERGVLYQIRENKLYRENNCNFPARCAGIEHFLLKLVGELDDMEMVINVSDWPQVNSWLKEYLPIFSFSKTPEFVDILYPAWTFWEGGPAISIYPKGLGRWDSLRKSIMKAAKRFPWDEKLNIAFFRGSRTSSERDALVLLSRDEPDLANAKYTKNQAWKSDADTLGSPAAEEIPLEEHCKFKYLFNYRGVAASFRFKHLFLCNSLVFHVGDQWVEFFYSFLRPWIHYIPVDRYSTKEQLRSLIKFTISHDQLAKEIADNGYNLIKSRLKLSHVTCYWRKLLTHYSKLINYAIQQRPNLIQVL